MKYFGFLLTLFIGLNLATAQENLVPNPSFEDLDGKVKAAGAIEVASPWKSVTMNPVDLYSEDAKSDEFSVPENKYGEEKARTGSNYAGISFFGYNGRMPRTYLGTTLSKPLEAGKEYCMKFHVSMSDYSKYAVNNLGIYVAKEEITEKADGNLSFIPQIKSIKNEAFDKQFLWTAICGVYKAEGGEQFIVIGNFDTDANTEQVKVRLSREFSGKRQENNAYYFIDDVSVVELNDQTKDDCLCDKIAGGKMEVEFKSFGTDKSKQAEAQKTFIVNSDGSRVAMNNEEKSGFDWSSHDILFDNKSVNMNSDAEFVLDEIVAYLEANPEVKIQISGHVDDTEASIGTLGIKRAYAVLKALRDKGIDESRMKHDSKQETAPIEKGNAALNRRVSFSLFN